MRKILPLILLIVAVVITAYVLGVQTGFFNRAAVLTSPDTNPTCTLWSPSGQIVVKPNQEITLQANASGGKYPYSYSWSQQSNGNLGTINYKSDNNTALWIGPTNPTPGQYWNISARVIDANQYQSPTCSLQLRYEPNPTPTLTPTPVPTTKVTPTPTPIVLKNLLINPSFEIGLENPGGSWIQKNLDNLDRRQQPNYVPQGRYVFRFAPDTIKEQESLSQTINYAGKANDGIVFNVDSQVPNITAGPIGAVVVIKYTDGTVNRNSITFGKTDYWSDNRIAIKATKPYSQIKVVLFNEGQVSQNTPFYYFVDDTTLTIQPNAGPSFVQTPSSLTPEQLATFNLQ